jgi:hypothetical protein
MIHRMGLQYSQTCIYFYQNEILMLVEVLVGVQKRKKIFLIFFLKVAGPARLLMTTLQVRHFDHPTLRDRLTFRMALLQFRFHQQTDHNQQNRTKVLPFNSHRHLV